MPGVKRPGVNRAVQRLIETTRLPWCRPRHEFLLLGLVALAALSVVQPPNPQDVSRLCLTRALVAGRLSADRCLSTGVTEDKATYGGHLYTDKAPGMSVLEVIPAEAVRLPAPDRWDSRGDARLWLVRLVAAGIPALVSAFLVGRISEGLAPGYGGAALLVYALGTEMGSLGIAGFDHALTGCLGFLAFVLAWGRRPLAAGVAAGLALTTEYEAAAILVVVLAYVALGGRRALGRYALGAAPGVALLGAYDWAAFGAPWHASYSHLANRFTESQHAGVLGIDVPTLHRIGQVLLGDRGLLVATPVLLAAGAGLVLLWRGGLHAEALVCLAVGAAFLVGECGYFMPYGGSSPGPRFLSPALPFVALGVGPALARWRVVTTALAAASVVASTALMLTWPTVGHYRDTVWGEIARVATQAGSSRLMENLPRNVLVWGANRIVGAALVSVLTVAAFAVAVLRAGTSRDAST